MLRVLEGFHVKIYENYNEDNPDKIEHVHETFNAGDMLDGEIIEESRSRIDFRFVDGWIALGIPKECVHKEREVSKLERV